MKKALFGVLIVLCLAGQSSAAIITKDITYKHGDTKLKGYLAYDDAIEKSRPGVLVVHEWWGHNDYARKRTEMLAELGYVAFTVDMYGDGKKAEHPEDAGAFSSQVMSNIDGILKPRFLAGLEFLRSQPQVDPDNVAAIGYCFGGSTVLHMARLGVDLKGVVSFHGGLSTQSPAQKGKVKAKVLVCHGAADNFAPLKQIEAFKKEMETAEVDYIFNSYEGAKHSFTNPEADKFAEKFGLGIAYNKQADEQSWNDMQEFFEKIFQSTNP